MAIDDSCRVYLEESETKKHHIANQITLIFLLPLFATHDLKQV